LISAAACAFMNPATPPPDIPDYELLRPVGRGAYGEVWLARHRVLATFSAVKIIRLHAEGDPDVSAEERAAADRVLRGVTAYLQRLPPGRSPGIAVLHVGRDPAGRFFYYAMELADDAVRGRNIDPEAYRPLTLRELCRQASGGRLAAADALRFAIRLAEGLQALHEAGLVHRDIKPSNIVFVRGEPILADIDLARPADATFTGGGAPGYIPPEGPGRPAGDVFSLGRTLYAVVTGLGAGAFPQLPDDWDQRPDIALLRELNFIILRACDDDPARRFQSARELCDELNLVEAGQSVAVRRRFEALRKRVRRATLLVTLAGLLVVAVSVGAWRIYLAEERAKFRAYQSALNTAAADLERRNFANTKSALEKADDLREGAIETALIERQTRGDRLMATRPRAAPVEQIVFGPNSDRFAALYGDHVAFVYLVSSNTAGDLSAPAPVATIAGVSELAGFLGDGDALGARIRDGKERPLEVFSAPDWGHKPGNRLDGIWLPAGVVGDGAEILAVNTLSTNTFGEYVRWRPGGAPKHDRWSATVSGEKNFALHAVCDVRGEQLLFYATEGVSDDFRARLYISSLTGETAGRPRVLEFSRPVGVFAVSPGFGRLARIDAITGELTVEDLGGAGVIRQQGREMRALAFSPDGRFLAAGGSEQTVVIHDAKTLAPISERTGHFGTITALSWSRNGRWLASGGVDGMICLWSDPQGSRPSRDVLGHLKIGGDNQKVVVDADERLAAATEGTNSIAIVRLDADELLLSKTVAGLKVPLCFTPDGRELWGMDARSGLIRLRLSDGAVTFRTNALGAIDGVAKMGVAAPDRLHFLIFDDRSNVVLWKITKSVPIQLRPMRSHEDGVLDAAYDDASAKAVTVGNKGQAYFWDANSGDCIPIPGIDTNLSLTAACFLPTTHWCLLGGESERRLIRVDERHPAKHSTVESEIESISGLVATPDGKRVFTGGRGARMGVLSVEAIHEKKIDPLVWFTHSELNRTEGAHTVVNVVYLPKSKRLLSLTDEGYLARW
jgi:WD40 repeat protein